MNVTFEAVAHYQRTGDGPADRWARERLDHAAETGAIHGGQSLGEWQAGWVQVVLFTFRFSLTATMDGSVPSHVATAAAVTLAESIVGESDVQVLGVKVIEVPHRRRWESDINDWWCYDCGTVTDFCSQLNPGANAADSSRNEGAGS